MGKEGEIPSISGLRPDARSGVASSDWLEVWGEVAIECLAAQGRTIFAFCSLCQEQFGFYFRLYGKAGYLQARRLPDFKHRPLPLRLYSGKQPIDIMVSEPRGYFLRRKIGILIFIYDDVVSQRALKNVLDSEGWRVPDRAVGFSRDGRDRERCLEPGDCECGAYDVRGPIFTTLQILRRGKQDAPDDADGGAARPKRIPGFSLYLGAYRANMPQRVLERQGLPRFAQAIPLNEFLEKVGD